MIFSAMGRVEGQLHDLETVPLAQDLRVAYQALDAEGGLATGGKYQGPRVGDGLADPQDVGDLVEILEVHAHVGLHADGAAVGGEVNALVAVLQDHHGLFIALQLGDAPVHAQEEVHPVHTLFYLSEHILADHEFLVVAGIHGGQEFDLIRRAPERFHRGRKGGVGGLFFRLGGHILQMPCTAGTLPKVGVRETAHDGANDEFQFHGLLLHADCLHVLILKVI